MATYTRIESVTLCHGMCTDGAGNLYVASYSSGSTTITIYKYVIATDTLTDISGATFAGYRYGSGFEGGLTWWSYNDKLYMVCGQGTPPGAANVFCFRWNGGQSWTQVDTQPWTSVGTLNPIIKSSPDRLAYKYDSATDVIRGTADGTSWGTDISTSQIFSFYYDVSQYDDLLCEIYDGSTTKVYRNTAGSTWAALSGADIGITQDFLGNNSVYSFFRARTGTNWVQRSTDWGVITTNIADLDIHDHAPSVFDLTYEVVALLSTGGGNQDQVRFWNAIGLTFDLDGTPNANDRVMQEPCYYAGYLYVLVEHDGIYVRDDPIGPVVEEDFSIPVNWSPTAMSVSPDDYYVYVGLLDGASNPVLLQLLSDLSADPIKAYDPGAGSAIGVHCADFNEEWVWIAGAFGGTLKVRVSIDDGATWTTKDPGTWNGVALPIVLGPDDDNLVLVPTDGDDDLFETEDGGLVWATLNAALPFDVNGMDRLDLNLDEIIMGSDADRGIRYSPNNGVTLHDLSDVAMANVRVSDLIIG